jgi:aminoglycoside phosphotransferase family enzyme/predicted kinase
MKTRELTESACSPSIDFTTMLQMLTQPAAFQGTDSGGDWFQKEPHRDHEPITVIQTHASAVVLTASRAYKLKKPKDFGFFDYSTPALRRHFCQQEVLLNARLAPQVYLGVAPVLLFSDDLRFGPTFPPGDVPLPGTMLDGGRIVDYAVVMVRLPDEATLEFRVRTGTASPSLLQEIARYVAAFHATSHADAHIASFGGVEVIRGNWEENFEQMKPYIDRSLDALTYHRIVEYICHFLDERAPLFCSRVQVGRIRDCHGDLRLQHVYILDEPDFSARRLAILDGIEFNERFRYSDVASEIAFLAMELEAAGRYDLSRVFVDSYVTETGDEALREVLPFYICYRACVRGKVCSFQLDEPEVPEAQREAAQVEAASLFALAASYASCPSRPTLLMMGGVMGTGKSTLAHALQHELGWALFSSDTIRKQLAHLDPVLPQADAFGQGVYSPERTARTYQTMLVEASAALASGRSVLLDASFIRRADRQEAAHEATARGAHTLFVECVCPREVVLERLTRRWKARVARGQATSEEASRASDGRPDLYDAQCAVWEAFAADKEAHTAHIVVSTTSSLVISVEQVLDALHMPHFACMLEGHPLHISL